MSKQHKQRGANNKRGNTRASVFSSRSSGHLSSIKPLFSGPYLSSMKRGRSGGTKCDLVNPAGTSGTQSLVSPVKIRRDDEPEWRSLLLSPVSDFLSLSQIMSH